MSELYQEEGNFQFTGGNGHLQVPQSRFYNDHVTVASENSHYVRGCW